MVKANREFNMDGIENLRELGGYKTKDGKTTKKGVYLRGGKTDNLSKKDMDILLRYGVNLEIDLRSKSEIDKEPSVLKDIDGVKYKSFNMLDGMATIDEKNEVPGSMYEVYKNLLNDGKDDYREIFKSFLENNGTSFFHCTIGKDRTGVLAMLILRLANVDDETIITDYSVSEKNLEEFFSRNVKKFEENTGIEVPRYFLESKKETMEKTLRYLDDKYGGAKDYLKVIGLSDKEIYGLNEKFLD